MSATDRRLELMALAEMLNKHRIELSQTIHKINEATALLVNEAEKLLPAVLNEKEAGPVSVRKLTSKVPSQIEHIAAQARQRKCSNCDQLGHTARTCINERAVEVNDEGDVVAPSRAAKAPKAKRRMKPLTEEQKAQRRASLVKARAARGKK
jgi:hypothetical protein